ncbi:MAG TPA: response regulator [Acidimicrobiia bacterium]|nr:response regulator [Acidimicrobiia bacterium]
MARAPVPINRKLVLAFGAVVALLVAMGAIGVYQLGQANNRTERLANLQGKVSIYRQLQNDTTVKLYGGASALFDPDPVSLDAALRQLQQSYDFSRLQFAARDERELLARIETTYNQFVTVMAEGIELVRQGKLAPGQELQRTKAKPLADQLERLTNQLVNRAESDIATLVDRTEASYRDSRRSFIAVAAGGIGLALLLGFAISWSIIGPVTQMGQRFDELASGDFSRHVEVANRDELGALAANLNRMNDELGRLYRDLEAASRHKSEFLASMSHELRTPLNAIIGFSEVLREEMFGPLNERQADYLNDILTSGRHLLSLINDILDLSKIEAGKMELDLATFALPGVLENGLTMIRERANNHGISLGLDVAPDVGEVTADERKIKQVVFNLLSNAVKFTPDGGRIDLSARCSNGEVEVAVRDTGIGIAPEDRERVFEEFQQAGQREGSGLGLALSRSFIELHGGTLRLDSELGVGSTFIFTLPLAEAPTHERASAPVQDQSAGAAAAYPEVTPAGPAMLVIEDDERSAELLRIFLEEAGFSVTVAVDGQDGLKAARRLRPAAIILDLLLPHVSGWDVLTELKGDQALADIPVIIVSMVDERGKGYALGAAGYLVKPVQRDELLGTLRPLTAASANDGQPATVLAIDDDPVALELVAAVLGLEGYRVVRAQGGKDGVNLALRERPGLVILDLLMPGTDGFEVVEQLRADTRTADIPIVVLTSKTIGEADRDRLNSRIAHLAEKGHFSRAEFVELVRRCCRAPVPD